MLKENFHPPQHVTFHISHAMCHMACVKCHVLHVMCNMSTFFFFGQSGKDYLWRVSYQQALFFFFYIFSKNY